MATETKDTPRAGREEKPRPSKSAIRLMAAYGGALVCDPAVRATATEDAMRALGDFIAALEDENETMREALTDAARSSEELERYEEAMREQIEAQAEMVEQLRKEIATLTQSRDQWRQAAEDTLAQMNAISDEIEAALTKPVPVPTPHPAPPAQETV